MRRLLTPFALGFAVLALVEVVAVFSINLLAEGYGWRPFELRAGPILLVEYERSARVATVTFGAGLFLVALGGGALNAAAAAVLQQRV